MTSNADSIGSSPGATRGPRDAVELIRSAVSLDLIGWLDLEGSVQGNIVANEVHHKLLAALRNTAMTDSIGGKASSRRDGSLAKELRRVGSLLIPTVNACTLDVLHKAKQSIHKVSVAEVSYDVRTSEDSGIGVDNVRFKFDDIPFIGDPLGALQNMEALRGESSIDQWHALELLIAIQNVGQATTDLGMAGSYDPNDVPRCQRKLMIAQKRVELLESRVRGDLQTLIHDTVACYQFYAPGIFPFAFEIPDAADDNDLLVLASAYENLSRELRQPLSWVISGSQYCRRQATQGWREYLACGVAFRVVAAWLRTLGNLNRGNQRCQYCYRHRVTKLRCLEHGSPVNESPAARLGRAINKYYVEESVAFSKVAKVRKALDASLIVNSAQWKSVLTDIRAERFGPDLIDFVTADRKRWNSVSGRVHVERIPPALRRSTAILVVQLRRIQAVLGPKFKNEARYLFSEMAAVASAALAVGHQSNDFVRRRAEEALYLLSLTNFLKLWFGRPDQTFSTYFPELKARGYDPYHFIVKGGSYLDSDVPISFLLQRAWNNAEANFVKHTSIDRQEIMKLRNGFKPLSLREIGKRFGCSYETIRRLVSGTSDRKYQRLKRRSL